ncbi:hypothetical protein FisN_6Hu117 [Fistulifera solaris]|uniref:Uncharacterized protein n=1 Tax=Fistulifera solaris TaxID=1519565 RepID=A0A1Z5KI87_FISSO|nr:hypothetical protein FisN_6Hu117 [Fistulifera solaris]|eukprot:GAX25845.1 hypothetical protein FisN_6Hu117 [Fistulifera solaris]
MNVFRRVHLYFFGYLLAIRIILSGALCSCSFESTGSNVNDCSEFCAIDIENDSIECAAAQSPWTLPETTFISGCTIVVCQDGACHNTTIDVGIESTVTCTTGACQDAELRVQATSVIVCEGDTSCPADSCQTNTCDGATIAAGVDSEIYCTGDACKETILSTDSNGAITCQGSTSCQTARMAAGIDTNVSCIYTGSSANNSGGTCRDTAIIADASCNISCHGDSTCQGMQLTSGVDAVIECLGVNACLDSSMTMGTGSKTICKDGALCDNQGAVENETVPETAPPVPDVQTIFEQSTDLPATVPTSAPSDATLGVLVPPPGKTAAQAVSRTAAPTAGEAVSVASSASNDYFVARCLPTVAMTALLLFNGSTMFMI